MHELILHHYPNSPFAEKARLLLGFKQLSWHSVLIPPVMPRAARIAQRGGRNVDYYEISMKQFQQQILPPGMPVTTVWGKDWLLPGWEEGMGLMKAAALAPDAILLPMDFEAYRHHSRQFKAAVVAIAPVMEDRGIDEIYLDLTDVPGAQDAVDGDPLGGVRALAQRIKTAVREATGLSCSIGVTPNKLLSKISSDLDKPDGLTVLMHDDVPARIWPLPVSRINGIGPKATERLATMGIRTIGELAATPAHELASAFGSHYGSWLHDAAHADRGGQLLELRLELLPGGRELLLAMQTLLLHRGERGQRQGFLLLADAGLARHQQEHGQGHHQDAHGVGHQPVLLFIALPAQGEYLIDFLLYLRNAGQAVAQECEVGDQRKVKEEHRDDQVSGDHGEVPQDGGGEATVEEYILEPVGAPHVHDDDDAGHGHPSAYGG